MDLGFIYNQPNFAHDVIHICFGATVRIYTMLLFGHRRIIYLKIFLAGSHNLAKGISKIGANTPLSYHSYHPIVLRVFVFSIFPFCKDVTSGQKKIFRRAPL